MIGIRIGDNILDLPGSARISLQLRNPLFNEDNLSPGSISLPFDLPAEESSAFNAEELGHPDVLENIEGFRKLDAQLLIDNIFFKKGKLIVRESTPGRINANFNFGLKTLSEEFKTKRLREILDETITIDAGNHPKYIWIKPGSLGSSPYKINVNGRTYEGNTLTDLANAITADMTEPRAFANYLPTGTSPNGMTAPFIRINPSVNPNDPLSPLHVDYPEDNGNSSSGFVWQVEAMDLTSYRSSFNSFLNDYQSATPPTNKVRFPVCLNNNMYGEAVAFPFSTIKQSNYVNARNSFGFLMNNPNYGLGINVPFAVYNINSVQPFIRLKYVLDKIAEYFGFQWEGNWFDADVEAALLDNAAPLDVAMDYLGKKKFVFWARSFNLNTLVEDLTVRDFLSRLQLKYNLGIYLNEKTGRVRIVKREAVAVSLAQQDLTPIAGRIQGRTDMRLTGVTIRMAKEENDALSVVNEYSVGDSEETIDIRMGGLPNESTTIAGDLGSVEGVIKSHPKSDKFGTRIFFYKGIIDNGFFEYPQALGNAINHAESATGIYNAFYKYWLYYAMRRRGVNLPVKYELTDLLNLDWEEIVTLDRKRFMVKQINVELSNSGLRISDVELYTMQ